MSAARDHRLLLVGGAPRSGTTLLMQVLNLHPRIALFYECNLPQTLAYLDQLFQKERKGTAGDRALTPREKFRGEDLAKLVPTQEKCLDAALAGIYRPVFPNKWWGRGPVWVGDKWNLLQRQADLAHLIAKYQVAVLWVTRNPVDTAASLLIKRGREGSGRLTRADILFDAEAEWLLAHRYAGWAAKHWNLFDLQYEDFALRPREWLAYIANWLGLSVTEEVKGAAVDYFAPEVLDGLVDPDVHHRTGLAPAELEELLEGESVGEYRRYLTKLKRAPESLATLGPAGREG